MTKSISLVQKRWGFMFLALILLISSEIARAEPTLVAFFPSPDEAHKKTFGEFYHVAIKAHGSWWETHPFYGVYRTPSLPERIQGAEVVILKAPEGATVIGHEELLGLEGIPFDIHSEWDHMETLYCTELVAHVLGVYHYAVPIVEKGFRIGELGLSPDRMFRMLQEESGFVPLGPKTRSPSPSSLNCQQVLGSS